MCSIDSNHGLRPIFTLRLPLNDTMYTNYKPKINDACVGRISIGSSSSSIIANLAVSNCSLNVCILSFSCSVLS